MFSLRLRQPPLRRLFFPFSILGAVLLILLSLPSSYSGTEPMDPPKAMLRITETDNGRTLNVHIGDSIQITLPENASTGYRWDIDGYTLDQLEKISKESNYPKSNPKSNQLEAVIGSGGTMSFIFQAKSAGKASIGLKYWRAWEGDASIVKRFHLRLNIQP
jgi:inhibitor of cysteine peptidase